MSAGQLRLIVDTGVGAASGLAMDEALCDRCAETGRSVLRLYTYRDHAVLVGRYQRVEAEVDLDAVAERGLDLNRRPTGGGTIVMGARQLGVAYAFREEGPANPKQVLSRFGNLLSRALERLGIGTTLAGKNDLEAGGRKLAGLGIYRSPGGATLCHASILAGIDLEVMAAVLRLPAAKLAAKVETELARRTVTASELLGREVSGIEIAEEIARGWSPGTGMAGLDPDRPSPAEEEEAARLVDAKYGTAGWVLSREGAEPREAVATFRTSFGTVDVALKIAGAAVRDASVSGDFLEVEPRLLAIPRALRWMPAAGRKLAATVADLLEGAVDQIEVERAFASALATDASPMRIGSCYLPEGSVL